MTMTYEQLIQEANRMETEARRLDLEGQRLRTEAADLREQAGAQAKAEAALERQRGLAPMSQTGPALPYWVADFAKTSAGPVPGITSPQAPAYQPPQVPPPPPRPQDPPAPTRPTVNPFKPATPTNIIVSYKGKNYIQLYRGKSKFKDGEYAKLSFMDGSKDFNVSDVSLLGPALDDGADDGRRGGCRCNGQPGGYCCGRRDCRCYDCQ